MTKRITPEIVIRPQVINSCWSCPHFQEYESEYDATRYYCFHDTTGKEMDKSKEFPYMLFDMEENSEIWVGCPLPKVDTVSEGESE